MRNRLAFATLLLCIGSIGSELSGQTMTTATATRPLPTLRAADAARSDSIDILHTRIDLDLTQTGSGLIAARTTLTWTPRMAGIDHLPLDLLDLSVDSVTDANGTLAFNHTDGSLTITLDAPHGPGDTLELTVHYHGDPVIDGSGWGGFYTNGSVVYDLGVAFESQPHSFGRAWFPCFDNFVERCSFEYIVRTNADRHAWCNGTLLEENDLGGGNWESHWINDETMPAYLASVTASTYAVVRDTFPSITGAQVPVTLVAQPSDTSDLKASFLHLQNAFDAFEQWFGPYRWDRIGYCLTPQGAMEHACNISYPTSIVDGSLTYEATMAHELAHHWFGNLVTCERAEEMYINEGFAEYLSYLFLEAVHGRGRYMDEVRDNHRAMVHRSHYSDEGWWALADMPQDHTYGTITYNKGADVLHALRSCLGDSLLSLGLKAFLSDHAFQPVSTTQLRDALSASTGVDLTDFFHDRILQPGWAAFEVDSLHVDPVPLPGGYYTTTAYLEQKLRGPGTFHQNVPLRLTYFDASGNSWTSPVDQPVGGQYPTATSAPPFVPVNALVDLDERLSLAITCDRDTLTTTGTRTYGHADLRLTVNSLPAAATLDMQEYWVAADDAAAEAHAYVVSPDRWWRVSGTLPVGADVDCRITFDGRSTGSAPIDVGLVADAAGVAFHEDSLVVLYRADASWPWTAVPGAIVNTIGSATDGFGRVDFNGFVPGDYALGWRKSAVGIRPGGSVVHEGWSYFPNPSQGRVFLEWNGERPAPEGTFEVLDSTGKQVLAQPALQGARRAMLDLDDRSAGNFLLWFVDEDGTVWPLGQVARVPGTSH